jgi:DNA-binding XRE family transcriptional regulator
MTRRKFTAIRAKLQRTQREMAELLGVSLKAVESYEQGWRRIPPNIERILYFLLFKLNKNLFGRRDRCWLDKKCPSAIRTNCPAWITREGLCCWFLTGKMCNAEKKDRTSKAKNCFDCAFFKTKLEKIID